MTRLTVGRGFGAVGGNQGVDVQFVIRFQVGQFDCRREDVLMAVDVLRELAHAIHLE